MSLTPTVEVLFQLLRAALHPEHREEIAWHEMPDWTAIYRLATAQGVTAIAWDGLQRLRSEGLVESQYDLPRALKLQWAMQVEQIERRYERQLASAVELTDFFAQNGVRTVVLKGFAISALYPKSNHRECGDLDCFLCGDYERGNQLAEKLGAKVERDFYKHSHIEYRQLLVENHQFCTAIRGGRERKEFEKQLQHLLSTPSAQKVVGSAMEIPSADFNALFLTAHGMSHFINEGLKLRHLCDWALLLQYHADTIDWPMFDRWIARMSYDRFVQAMTALVVSYLGVSADKLKEHLNDQYNDRMLEDMLWGDRSIYNSGKSRLEQRWMLITNRFRTHWKYRLIYRRSMAMDVMRMIYAYFFEKQPKLS